MRRDSQAALDSAGKSGDTSSMTSPFASADFFTTEQRDVDDAPEPSPEMEREYDMQHTELETLRAQHKILTAAYASMSSERDALKAEFATTVATSAMCADIAGNCVRAVEAERDAALATLADLRECALLVHDALQHGDKFSADLLAQGLVARLVEPRGVGSNGSASDDVALRVTEVE